MKILTPFIALLLIVPGPPLSAQGNAIRLPDARVGEPYEYGVVAQGLVEPIHFSWDDDELPPGLVVDGPRIYGVPTESRTEHYPLRLVIIDALNDPDPTFTVDLQLQVRPVIEPLRIVTRSLPILARGEAVDIEFGATGGEGRYRWTAESDALPQGLRIDLGADFQSCRLTGTPTTAETFQIELRVADGRGTSQLAVIQGAVRDVGPVSPLRIACNSLPPAAFRAIYSQRLCAEGGIPPYRWEIEWEDGEAPPWLRVDAESGLLGGRAEILGTYRMNLAVVDQRGERTEIDDLTLEVKPADLPQPLTIHPDVLPSAVLGEVYQAEIVASGSRGYVRWEIDWTDRPPWLVAEIDGAVVKLRGDVTDVQPARFTVRVFDLDRPSSLNGAIELEVSEPSEYGLEVVELEASGPRQLWIPLGLASCLAFLAGAVLGTRYPDNKPRAETNSRSGSERSKKETNSPHYR